jgi:hypothetical protein
VPISRAEVMWEHPVFLIPKKGGKLRKIMDCSALNAYMKKTKFKLED